MDESFVVRLTTHPAMIWWIRHVVSRIDPWIFRATNGHFTAMGRPGMPMVTLETRGRRSGRRRLVHLACIEHAGESLVVASAMGQEKHPGWRYNLEAQPEVVAQFSGERRPVRAVALDDREKRAAWDAICAAIPQVRVYETMTSRDIRVFRLERRTEEAAA